MNKRTCSVDECGRKAECKGFCGTHYRRWLKTGDPGPIFIKTPVRSRGEKCKVDGCDAAICANGFCKDHYARERRHGDPLSGRPFRPGKECDGVHRRCRECLEVKPLSAFKVEKRADRSTHRHMCIDCTVSIVMKKRYGIGLQQYNTLLEAQGGGCAICGRPPGEDGRSRLCIDHDHVCCPGEDTCGNCVRGLLCISCNAGLGSFRDQIELLRRAETYLMGGRTTSVT